MAPSVQVGRLTCFLSSLCLVAAFCGCSKSTKVEEILRDPNKYVDQTVTVEGLVIDVSFDRNQRATVFSLADANGHTILTIYEGDLNIKGKSLVVVKGICKRHGELCFVKVDPANGGELRVLRIGSEQRD
ncbi:MAG: hypothetical protein HY961_13485 [Ignavibacteriae bacterium]|nr:hypothetical protein [Ignavibacteriota bacterium]